MTRLFFDGTCGLCRGAVRLVARHDSGGRVRFAPLGGATFQQLIPDAVAGTLPDSLVVRTPSGDILTQSRAVIHLLRQMDRPWPWMGVLLAWVPAFLRDGGYGLVARMRASRRACSRVEVDWVDRLDP